MIKLLPKKISTAVIVLLFISIGLIPGVSSISPLGTENSFDGDILYVGGNDPGCYATIQGAINAAKSGDTIFVYDDSSPYYENIVISKSINLIGESKDTTVIDGGNSGNVVDITIDHVNISGFSIQNSGGNVGININSDYVKVTGNNIYDNSYGIRFEYSHNNIVSSSKITNNNCGVYLYGSSNVNIYENTVTDGLVGIQLCLKSKYNVIYGNDITNNKYGISLNDSSYSDIYWNIIADGHYGIYSYDSSDNSIHGDNVITDNQEGIYLCHSSHSRIYGGNTIVNNDDCGIYLFDSSNINIHENDITNNKYGISLNDSSNGDIYWNHIRYNKYGIYLCYSSGNNVYLNNITDNYLYGLYVLFSSNSKIVYNNFITNYNPAYFKQSFFSFNSWKKNYWDNWGGAGSYKINGEIEGIINLKSWFNFDLHPVKQPYEI